MENAYVRTAVPRAAAGAGRLGRLGRQAALVVLVILVLTSCGPKPAPQVKPAAPARAPTPAPAPRRAQAEQRPPLPAALTLLAGDPDTRGRIAVVIGEVGTGAASRQAPPPYEAVFGHQPLGSTSAPAQPARPFRATLDTLAKRGVQEVDVWVSGLDGLIVRYAVERGAAGRPPVRRVVVIDTPHRGLSPAGWPDWTTTAVAKPPEWAVAGSSFLVELNGDPVADLAGVDYLTVWRDMPQSALRASVMQLPRRGVQVVLRPPAARPPLALLLDTPVTAARTIPASGDTPRTQPDGPTGGAPLAAPTPPPPLRALLTGGLPDAVSRQAETWVRFAADTPAAATDVRLWRGRSGDLTADTLLGLTDPVTIAYVLESNEVVITGYEDYARAPLTADLFWAAVRAHRRAYPAVSIDPPGHAEAPEASVRYEGETRSTRLGGVMFEADRVMKALSLGKDNITSTALSSRVPGHTSIAAATTLGTEALGTLWRLWFEPRRWHAREPPGDRLSATIEAAVQCRWERMTPEYAPSQPVVAFTERLTADYQRYAREQPALDALEQAAVLVAMAQWLEEANGDADLGPGDSALTVATPDRTPLLQVPTESRSGPLTVVLQGGVVFCAKLRHVQDPGARSRALTVAALRARPPGAGAWEFRDAERVLRAVAVPARLRQPGVPPGIRIARDQLADPAHTSDTCVAEVFRLLGPMITHVLLDDTIDPPEVILHGVGFGRAGRALFNSGPLRTPTWTPTRVVTQLSPTPQAGTLVLQAAGRDSNPVVFTLAPDWERRGPPQLTLVNRAPFPLRVTIRPQAKGSTRDLTLAPSGQEVTRVLPGRYTVTAQAQAQWTLGAVQSRDDQYERGRAYTLTYDTKAFPLGELVIKNDTGSTVNLQVKGPVQENLTVPTGRTTVRLAPGSYTITVKAACGTQTDTATISPGATREFSYWCTYMQR